MKTRKVEKEQKVDSLQESFNRGSELKRVEATLNHQWEAMNRSQLKLKKWFTMINKKINNQRMRVLRTTLNSICLSHPKGKEEGEDKFLKANNPKRVKN